MKALLCKQWGQPEELVLEDVENLKAGKGQVVIEVKAASVNFPDTLIIQNLYQFKPELPFAPGGECAGVICEVGEGVEHLKVGDKVLALTIFGSFAEQVVTDARMAVPLPDGVSFPEAASFAMTYGTSYHALVDRGQLKSGETLLVLGAAGGVGLAAIEIGKQLGAKVIAAASSADKLAVCAEHGADELINYAEEDLRARLKDITGGKGVDVIYDPVGGDYTEAALRSCAWRGRFLVVGFAAGGIPKIPANLTLLKGCSVNGVFWGDFVAREPDNFKADMRQLFSWLQQGHLRPHIAAQYPLEEGGKAIRALMNRQVSGKVVVTV
ncbi:NADPH:quinone oxidoreductase family protein [Spongiibacter sp. KMU-158]|uniref:NADPH:quinone oxidoreductase family protein n=1 Tax=Spongiibacter pelagi TaxID=2760804 RepID=A0A927GWK0_9GAMM|nr:NADPH:quinone oxidoreductase family protein [Spongiibacter pelagi]MBD2859831.1 NADPH:quinone oxidoreductase family protein [Spongiibacter pelagi]